LFVEAQIYRQGAEDAKVAKEEKKQDCFSLALLASLAPWR
jgi:hypothetical protein